MKDIQFREKFGCFRQRAHWAALCFACLGLLLLNLPEAGYSAAIMVKKAINLNDNIFYTDSYNSSDPTESTNGLWDAMVSGDAGDVICIEGISNSAPVGNAFIYGRAYVASGSGVALGPYGFIGTLAWAELTNNTAVELGYLVPNTNFPFTNISLPDYSGFLGPVIPFGAVVMTNFEFPDFENPYVVTNAYDSIICGNYFTTNSLGNAVVTCPSTLVLPNGLSFETITIALGASLKVYIGGTNSVTLAGSEIANVSGLPGDFVIYCTSNVTSLVFSANPGFSGVFIAPNADARFNGGRNTDEDFSGAIMANSLSLYGDSEFAFHFDEALLQEGIVPQSPSLAASLMAPVMSTSGQFQFNVTGVPSFNYVVESSTDLTDWQPLFTNASPFTFTDTNANSASQNFYRAVYNQ